MVKIYGYKILEKLYNGSRTLVYRAVRDDEKSVVIKLLKNSFPSFSELVQFRNQYAILNNINSPFFIQVYSLENNQNSCALVMEDMSGISLTQYFVNIPSLQEFLQIAISLCDILDSLYRHRIIHKDIKPSNILINPDTKKLKLIDFSVASLLPNETQVLVNPNVLEGTLAYISPEQTGRMNRGIDYRTDFYSLGVTFYELLTGELPFKSDDAMELLHCHIAKTPILLGNREWATGNSKEIPQVLSDIVMKLMAKNAEDRYQSALGLKSDLEFCLHQLEETGKIKDFKIAQKDICERFIILEKLYGRETEVEQLLAVFDRVAGNEGKAELILVRGISGIGKTAVVNEVHKPIVKQHGYFIKGKFDQYNRNIPYCAFVQAFRDLMGQLLSENDAKLSSWKHKILQALGDNAQVIIDVIPELEQIIKKQPAAPELSSIATQNRFNLLFQNFIQVFTSKEHPLAIFLDDLQWADSASLKLIQLLMEAETNNLLLIGAYRDNEVSAAHPLILMLDRIKFGAVVNTITLKPLSKRSLINLVADTLSTSTQSVKLLCDIIYQKTKGNPFFTTQFLKALHQYGLIKFDSKTGYWQYNINKIRSAGLTNDIVKFMVLQLHKLPESTQHILKLAACIGNQFDLETLAIISQKSKEETAACLWKALSESVILPQSDGYKFFLDSENTQVNPQTSEVVKYKFLHDRIQQAAYSLIGESDKQKTHWQIGQSLIKALSAQQLEDRLFEVVNQLNHGFNYGKQDADNQDKILRLNLKAAIKAKESIAYAAAVRHFEKAISLLAADCWESQYQLTLEIYRQLAEAEYLNSNFARAESLVYHIINKVKTDIEKADLYHLLVVQFTLEAKYDKAIKVGEQGLKILGINIALDNLQPAIDELLHKIQREFQQIEIASILQKSAMMQADKKAAIKLLINLDPPAYITGNLNLYIFISLKAVLLSLEYGNAAESVKAYANYGLILGTVLGDYQTGYKFGSLAYSLSEIFQQPEQICKASLLLSGWLTTWNQPITSAEEVALNGYQAGNKSGEIQFAGYNLFTLASILHFKGTKLRQLQEKISNWLPFVEKTKNNLAFETITALQFSVSKLLGESNHTLQYQSPFALAAYHIYQSQASYILNQLDASLNHALEAEKLTSAIAGFVTSGEYHFYAGLIFVDSLQNISVGEQKYWEKIDIHREKLKIWAKQCPQNFRQKYLLLEAEINRVNGDFINAIENYDKAIKAAQSHKYIHEEALANELLAKFYLDWEKEKVAATYMLEAYYCYARWGSSAKINQLEKRYPQLLTAIVQKQNYSFSNPDKSESFNQTIQITKGGNFCENLDLASILKATRALSSEIHLEKLVAKLMQLAIENAGAKKAALILLKEDILILEAVANTTEIKLLNVPCLSSKEVPNTLINYVKRSLKTIVFDDATGNNNFIADSYLIEQQPKSLLCMPILNKGKLIGLLYLENNLTIGAFTHNRIEILNLLITQAAISIQNAQLYHQLEKYSYNLEQKVEQRTLVITEKATQLESTLKELQRTQAQLIQTEKMSGLGQLVAGIAHEINNPINFIYGNLTPASEYALGLIELINLYKESYSQPLPEIESKIAEMELDFIIDDLPKLLDSMSIGAERIREIVISLRNFSRLDEAELKPVDIHSGIDSTLLILQHQLIKNPEIEVVKQYNQLPLINCYASQLNQVFLNIINNAIYALRENQNKKSVITISTLIQDKRILIKIKDNGVGINKSVLNKIFDPFFTTKPVGSGTGLGLSTSYSIVVTKHRGNLSCNSILGEGTEFIIELPIA